MIFYINIYIKNNLYYHNIIYIIGSSILLVKLVNRKPVEITSKMQRELKEKLESRDKYIEDVK